MNNTNLPFRPKRYKVISFGDPKTGKTCLIKRYYEKRFVPKYLPTIGVDYGHTTVTMDQKEFLINIFDFSGDSMFYEVRNEFYAGAQGALLVFDVTNRKSFENLDWWLAEMCQEMEVSEYYRATIIVCANKKDSPGNGRVVSTLEAQTWAENLGFPYLETSASTNEGVDTLFEMLFRSLITADEMWKDDKPTNRNNLRQTGAKRNGQPSNTEAIRREMIERLTHGKDDLDKMGLEKGATNDDVNRQYRRLAVMLHPDKNSAPGAEEVFKTLTAIRCSVLSKIKP